MSSHNGRMRHDDEYDDERTKLLKTMPPGISARTHSINGTQSVVLEEPHVRKSRWRSIRVMYLTMFLSSVSFSICMSSLYPYLKILDPSAGTNFLGWIVAAYSLGQLVASPFFGAWSTWRARTREPIIVSLVINILANILYMYLESFKIDAKAFLILSRVLIGFGAGNVAVVRSYVSGATTTTERTPAMANMSAFQAIGFIIGPLIQTAMVPIGYPGLVHTSAFHLDLYTATAFFSVLVGIVNVVLLIVVFKQHRVEDDLITQSSIQSRSGLEDPPNYNYKIDRTAVWSAVALFFSVLFIFAVFETIATPMTMHMFAWTKTKATLYVGFTLGGAGVISIFVFGVIKVLSKRFNERYLLLGGFIFCCLGFVVYLPWGNDYPAIQPAVIGPSSFQNGTTKPSNWTTPFVTTEKPGTVSTSFPLTTEVPGSTEWTTHAKHTTGAHTSKTTEVTTSAGHTSATMTTAPELTTRTETTTQVVTTERHTTKGELTSSAKLTTRRELTTIDIQTTEAAITTSDAQTTNDDLTTDSTHTSAGYATDIKMAKDKVIPKFIEKTDDDLATDSTHTSAGIATDTKMVKDKVIRKVREAEKQSESLHFIKKLSDRHESNTKEITMPPVTTTSASGNTSVEPVGCPNNYEWCYNTPAIRLWQFFIGTIFIAIGYPTCNVMTYTIYSKILGPKPQGMWMGVLTAAGSLARTLGPVFVSQVYDAYGPRITFISLLVLIVVTVLGLLLVFRRLVPYKITQTVIVD